VPYYNRALFNEAEEGPVVLLGTGKYTQQMFRNRLPYSVQGNRARDSDVEPPAGSGFCCIMSERQDPGPVGYEERDCSELLILENIVQTYDANASS
jgi:hypothetical protein